MQIRREMQQYEVMYNTLHSYLKYEIKTKTQKKPKITIKKIPDMLIAAIRFHGQYKEEPIYFAKLVKVAGQYFLGGSLSMCYGKKKEGCFDIEMAVFVSQPINTKQVRSRILKGGKAVTLQYKGPYEDIAKAYDMLSIYCKTHHLKLQSPPREFPIKGMWNIIPRPSKQYITEIQFMVA